MLEDDDQHARRVAGFDPTVPYASWQTNLVVAAVRDRALQRGLEPVVFAFTPYGGDRVRAGSTLRPQAAYSPGVAALVQNVDAAAARAHASVSQITVFHPRGLAAAVILDVSDPGRFLRDRMSAFISQAFPRQPHGNDGPTSIDGWYLEVRSGDQAIAVRNLNQRLNGAGSGWTAPRFSGCDASG